MESIKTKNLYQKHGIWSVQDLKRHYENKAGGHWFSESTMRFFKSRLLDDLVHDDELFYFLSSEQKPHGSEPRAYSVRSYNPKSGRIDTVGEFQEFPTLHMARKKLKELSK